MKERTQEKSLIKVNENNKVSSVEVVEKAVEQDDIDDETTK